jgi:hypothetical protein
LSSIDDEARFEERIRGGLASRDPGPAPARLHHRVGALTSTIPARSGLIHRFGGIFRPAVAATMTLAAVLLGVLVVSVIRRASLVPTGPDASPGAGPAVDLGTVGDPLGLPIGWTVFVALVALLAAWAVAEVYLGTPSGVGMALGRLRRKRARGLLVLVLAAPILILGQVVRFDASLTQGGFFEASLVHLEGMGSIPSGTSSRDEPAAWFRNVSGGTVVFVQSVRNGGRLPITVTGGTGADFGLELRLFARHDPSGPIDVDIMPTYPFAPFQLAPGEEREIVVAIHLASCPGSPAPSSEPSPDLSGSYVPSPPYASQTFSSVGLAYSVLGFAREVDVPLFAAVAVRSPDGAVCATDPSWANPTASPGGP